MSPGFKVEFSKRGGGARAVVGQTVTVHCTGVVASTGKKFWSTKDTDEPFSFRLGVGEVISAWDIGVAQMGVGDAARITAPHDMAYGDAGFPEWGIPPRAMLLFDVELLSSR